MKKRQTPATLEGGKRVEALEKKVTELTAIIEGYKSGEIGAEGRIKTLTEMHAKKVKMLMRSIDQLKRDALKDKALQKDNVRSKLLEQYKKEIVTQDTVISVLRGLVGDDDRCDREIVAKLDSGPERVRAPSREELKTEIEKLKRLLAGYKERLNKAELGVKDATLSPNAAEHNPTDSQGQGPNSGEKYRELYSKYVEVDAELNDLKQRSNQELKDKETKLLEQQRVLEDVKIELDGKEDKIRRLEELLQKSNAELSSQSILKIELEALTIKYNALLATRQRTPVVAAPVRSDLNATNEEYQIKYNALLDEYNKDKVAFNQERSKLTDQISRLATDISKLKLTIEELKKQLHETELKNQDVRGNETSLQQKIEALKKSYEDQIKALEQKYEELLALNGRLRDDKKRLNDRYSQLLVQIEDLENRLQEKHHAVDVYQAKLLQCDREITKLRTALGENAEISLSEDVSGEVTPLKETVKALAQRELDLLVEMERLKKNPPEERQSATNSQRAPSEAPSIVRAPDLDGPARDEERPPELEDEPQINSERPQNSEPANDIGPEGNPDADPPASKGPEEVEELVLLLGFQSIGTAIIIVFVLLAISDSCVVVLITFHEFMGRIDMNWLRSALTIPTDTCCLNDVETPYEGEGKGDAAAELEENAEPASNQEAPRDNQEPNEDARANEAS